MKWCLERIVQIPSHELNVIRSDRAWFKEDFYSLVYDLFVDIRDEINYIDTFKRILVI